jgi:hypothetical protein
VLAKKLAPENTKSNSNYFSKKDGFGICDLNQLLRDFYVEMAYKTLRPFLHINKEGFKA